MPTYTTNYTLAKPLVNDPTDADQWGTLLNSDLDTIDSTLKSISDATYSITSSKTANYTIVSSDRNKTILVDATAGPITISLIASVTATTGFKVTIKKIDSSSNTVTIDGNLSETIDGSLTKSLPGQYQSITIVCDGTNWQRVDSVSIATQSEMEAQTTGAVPDASVLKYHPLMPKAICLFNGTGTPSMTYQSGFSTSITDNGVGDYTLTLSTAMSSSSYPVIATVGDSTDGSDSTAKIHSRTTTTIRIRTTNNGSPEDWNAISVIVFGDI